MTQVLRDLLTLDPSGSFDPGPSGFFFIAPGPSGSFGSGPSGSFGSGPSGFCFSPRSFRIFWIRSPGFFFYPRSFGIFDPDPSGSTASGPLGSFGPQVIQHLPPPGSFAALLPDVHHSSWGHSCAFFFFCYSVQGLSIIDCEPKHPVQSFHFFGAMVE